MCKVAVGNCVVRHSGKLDEEEEEEGKVVAFVDAEFVCHKGKHRKFVRLFLLELCGNRQ